MLPQFLCFSPPRQGLQLRRETILYLLQAFMRQDSHAHQLMGGQRWSCDRVQGLQGKRAGQCRTCVQPARPHPRQLSLRGGAPLPLLKEVPGYRQPPPPPPQPRGWSSSRDKALQHSSARFEETMLGNEVISLNPSLPLHPACPPKPSPALLRLWATKEVSLQCCEGNEWHLTNIYSNERTSGQIYTLARGSHDLQRCCPVLGSCRSAASQSRNFSVHKTACCNFRYCCFLQSFQAL